jgi:hypothetical protein
MKPVRRRLKDVCVRLMLVCPSARIWRTKVSGGMVLISVPARERATLIDFANAYLGTRYQFRLHTFATYTMRISRKRFKWRRGEWGTINRWNPFGFGWPTTFAQPATQQLTKQLRHVKPIVSVDEMTGVDYEQLEALIQRRLMAKRQLLDSHLGR